MPLPKAFAPVLFGALQCEITTGCATALSTLRQDGPTAAAVSLWLSSWLMSWAMLLPIVVTLAPALQKLVRKFVADGPS